MNNFWSPRQIRARSECALQASSSVLNYEPPCSAIHEILLMSSTTIIAAYIGRQKGASVSYQPHHIEMEIDSSLGSVPHDVFSFTSWKFLFAFWCELKLYIYLSASIFGDEAGWEVFSAHTRFFIINHPALKLLTGIISVSEALFEMTLIMTVKIVECTNLLQAFRLFNRFTSSLYLRFHPLHPLKWELIFSLHTSSPLSKCHRRWR